QTAGLVERESNEFVLIPLSLPLFHSPPPLLSFSLSLVFPLFLSFSFSLSLSLSAFCVALLPSLLFLSPSLILSSPLLSLSVSLSLSSLSLRFSLPLFSPLSFFFLLSHSVSFLFSDSNPEGPTHIAQSMS